MFFWILVGPFFLGACAFAPPLLWIFYEVRDLRNTRRKSGFLLDDDETRRFVELTAGRNDLEKKRRNAIREAENMGFEHRKDGMFNERASHARQINAMISAARSTIARGDEVRGAIILRVREDFKTWSAPKPRLWASRFSVILWSAAILRDQTVVEKVIGAISKLGGKKEVAFGLIGLVVEAAPVAIPAIIGWFVGRFAGGLWVKFNTPPRSDEILIEKSMARARRAEKTTHISTPEEGGVDANS